MPELLEMLSETFNFLTEYSHYPCIVAGDLSLVLEEGRLDLFLLQGQWHDALQACAHGGIAVPTCCSNDPKRTDHIL